MNTAPATTRPDAVAVRARVRSAWLDLERRVANPAVTAILRSPAHSLVSRRLCVLGYEGRRTGRYYETPVLYRETDDGVVLLTPMGVTNWWRNFEGGHPASVLLRGEWRDGTGEVVTDDAVALAHLRFLLDPVRRLSRLLLGGPLPGEKRLQRAVTAVALVWVTLEARTEPKNRTVERLT